MKSIPDVAGEARRAWLCEMQRGQTGPQSDFEKSLAFRSTLIVAIFVIGINLFSPPPAPATYRPAHVHATT